MSSFKLVEGILEKISDNCLPKKEDLEFLLSLKDRESVELVFSRADDIRKKEAGRGILLRGIIEFSNICANTCMYCGLNKNNLVLKRYDLSAGDILESTKKIVEAGIKTVVLQSGENKNIDPGWFAEVIKEIKIKYQIAVTLSVGERSFSEYNKWKKAGADRYLLKIETSNAKLYSSLHPGMDFMRRVRCYKDLKTLGYQTGSGCLIGLRGQEIQHLAEDLIFFKKNRFDMIGIGVFIPHRNTVLAEEPGGDENLSVRMLALTRILNPYCHLPVATSLGIKSKELRKKAFNAGANVFMPNFTPSNVKELYEIYPGKTTECGPLEVVDRIEREVVENGRFIDYGVGHSLLKQYEEKNNVYSSCK